MRQHRMAPRHRLSTGGTTAARCAFATLLVAVAGLVTACDAGPLTLKGTLSVAGEPAPANVVVAAYSDTTDQLVARTRTDAAGTYAFAESTLPAGTYRIRFGDGSWWQDATTWADATPVAAASSPTTVLDATITAPSATIAGTVRSRHGRPVAGATVAATSPDGATTLATTLTGADGSYTLTGLSATIYAVHVTAPTFAEQWYGGTAVPTGSEPVDLDDSSSRAGVDVTLPPESRLTGQFIGVPGAMNGVIAVAYDRTTGLAVGSALAAESYGYANFTIGGLPAGTYTVGVFDPSGKLATEVRGASGAAATAGTVTTLAEGRSTSIGQMPVHGVDCPLNARSADLTGRDFSGKHLANCDFTAATLTNANFAGADLTNATFGSGHVHGANFAGANLDHTSFFVTDVSGATFTGANLVATNFKAASLAGATFGGSQLGSVRSGDVVGTPVGLGAGWTMTRGYLIGPHADLQGADLSGLDLSGRNLSGANLTIADLTGANLTGANLTAASFYSANVTGATLTGANLTAASLIAVTSGGIVGTPASLPGGAVLVGGALLAPNAKVNGVDVDGADLSGANLAGATISNITGTPSALPAQWALHDGHLIGPGATITGTDVDGLDLSAVGLFGIRSGGLTGTPTALPAGWVLHNGYLVGPGAQLPNAQLAELDAPGIDLSGVNLNGADLTGATLTGANLKGAHIANASLAGADLSGANLTNAEIRGTSIAGTKLGTATLTGVYSGNTTGPPASLPAGIPLVAGYLLCPGANIAYADLTGADLSGLDLTGAVLTLSKLDGADLAGTQLSGALLNSASLVGADVSGTDLSGVVLDGSTSSGLTGTPAALPAGWVVIDGELVPPNG